MYTLVLYYTDWDGILLYTEKETVEGDKMCLNVEAMKESDWMRHVVSMW